MTENSNSPQNTPCQVALMPSGRRGSVSRGTNLLQAARELGVELESICGGRQTCMKCQVIVEDGNFQKHGIHSSPNHLSAMAASEAGLTLEQRAAGRRLACAAEVLGDLLITVPEESQARKQIIAKAATDRIIEVDPALRLVYVEIPPSEMSDGRGDLERLQQALADEWNLHNLQVDGSVYPTLQSILRQGNFAVTATIWQDSRLLRIQPGYSDGLYGLAVDVGSTTVVAHLCDLRTGAVLATEASMNPQVRYGEDLMSRVSYADTEPQGMARLNRAILRTINELVEKCAARAGIGATDILDIVIVGNTIMHHILLGIHPHELGGAPFALATGAALDLRAADFGIDLHPAACLHTLPLIAGHVGADNVAVQLAEAPHEQDEIMLIVDVGTNAEIVLGDRQQILVASSPTGPAFEGAQISHGQRAAPGAVERVRIDPQTLEPRIRLIGSETWLETGVQPPLEAKATGICGSGIIEAIAEMFMSGIINSGGLFEASAAERSQRIQYRGRTAEYTLVDAENSATGAPIVITQNDVRQIQLAKAALYAGARLLMGHRGVDKVDRIVLAGAFGSFISPLHAMVLGMIPDCDLERVYAVGNAAGDGARIALLNRGQRRRASELAAWARHIATPLEASFQEQFVAALNLPHAVDPFPTLEKLLPDQMDGRQRRPRNRSRERLHPSSD